MRKSLVGDVTFLYKVFLFLESWGLINYGAPSGGDGGEAEKEHEEERCEVKVEEGAPSGIRVVATPNSLKPLLLPRDAKVGTGGDNGRGVGIKMPPLASYSDVYGDLIRRKEVNCGNCDDKCGSEHYRSTKVDFSLISSVYVCYGISLLVLLFTFNRRIWLSITTIEVTFNEVGLYRLNVLL